MRGLQARYARSCGLTFEELLAALIVRHWRECSALKGRGRR